MPEPEQMPELVHQSEIGKSAIRADVVADRAEARDARVNGDVHVGPGLPAYIPPIGTRSILGENIPAPPDAPPG